MQTDPFRAVGLLLSAIVVIGMASWPFQLLWNMCLVGAITGINSIGYPQAVGIVLMFGLLLIGAIAMFSLFTVSRDNSDEDQSAQ